ncbi:unnamed protein product [Didymodactylos carnosus]|uniref:HMG box domain-containing protein n=1 Tax=Didymodactylos carnosus TaxID=1234261 RepID=A0A8S2GY97_9BILA|nr:unnamed protein product [Didymodactylos carnosus]CAF3575771.1 unnamed protein product [Didymodactylos carnosus]
MRTSTDSLSQLCDDESVEPCDNESVEVLMVQLQLQTVNTTIDVDASEEETIINTSTPTKQTQNKNILQMPKPSRSAFYFYAIDYKNRVSRLNGRNLTIQEAIESCYDEWKSLPDEAKQPYKERYEEWRLLYRTDPDAAMAQTTSGPLPGQRQYYPPTKSRPGGPPSKTNEEKMLHERETQQTLNKRVIPCEELQIHYNRFNIEKEYLAHDYLPLDLKELLQMPIYLINFQIFCKIDVEDGGQFVPAEMSVLKGPTTWRHAFIKPEKIPPGYMSACLEMSKTKHEIPIRDFESAVNNYGLLYEQLKSVVMPFSSTSTMSNNDGGNGTSFSRGNNENMMNSSTRSSRGAQGTEQRQNEDDRTKRRQRRLNKPCVFYPAVEHEQTNALLDWLQEKAENKKPTRETRLVDRCSIESLIMTLAQLKNHRVSTDDLDKTFQNAAYTFMVDQRCEYHQRLGNCWCSVSRCHAAAKLISTYLTQLYYPNQPQFQRQGKRQSAVVYNSSSYSENNSTTTSQQSSRSVTPTSSFVKPLSINNSMANSETSDSLASSNDHLFTQVRKQMPPSQPQPNRTNLTQIQEYKQRSQEDFDDTYSIHSTSTLSHEKQANSIISPNASIYDSIESQRNMPIMRKQSLLNENMGNNNHFNRSSTSNMERLILSGSTMMTAAVGLPSSPVCSAFSSSATSSNGYHSPPTQNNRQILPDNDFEDDTEINNDMTDLNTKQPFSYNPVMNLTNRSMYKQSLSNVPLSNTSNEVQFLRPYFGPSQNNNCTLINDIYNRQHQQQGSHHIISPIRHAEEQQSEQSFVETESVNGAPAVTVANLSMTKQVLLKAIQDIDKQIQQLGQ